jgi:hypothetical protein
MKKFLKFAICSAVVLAIAWLLLITVQGQKNSNAKLGNVKPVTIVGRWMGSHGVVMDLRTDGTVRTRQIDDKSNTIHYFKYRFDGKNFCLDYAPRPGEYLQRLGQFVGGVASDPFVVAKLSDTELQLADSTYGATLVFTKTEDAILADAP